MNRREFVAIGATALAAITVRSWFSPSTAAAGEKFEVTHTDAEWRQLLTPGQYAVLRQEATERAFTSPLLHEKRHGIFSCAGCALDLFSSATKFDSGTGSASGPRWIAPSAPLTIRPSAWRGPRCTAAVVAVTWATSSTMGRSRPACVTA